MKIAISLIKKTIILIATAMYVSVLSVSLTHAQNDTQNTPVSGISTCSDTLSCMKAITQNTYGTLQALNTTIAQYLANMTTADSSNSPTAAMQGNFTTLGNLISQSLTQTSDPVQLSVDLYSNQPNSNTQFSTADFSGNSPKILQTIPYINDVSYSTLLGLPPVAKAPAIPYNYIKNASGMTLAHTIPSAGWTGGASTDQYIRYYKTIMAVESFNSYILNSQYVNAQDFTTAQTALINQATSGDQWFTQIASEEIGKVLRQILMFDSQSYVLLSQLIQVQKQLLAAQIMTNTLLISNNIVNETNLVNKAQGG